MRARALRGTTTRGKIPFLYTTIIIIFVVVVVELSDAVIFAVPGRFRFATEQRSNIARTHARADRENNKYKCTRIVRAIGDKDGMKK